MQDLHITLLAAALAALICFWLAMHCGRVRTQEKILHGDGGSEVLMRRMRAQANFTEYTPLALILILALDLADQDGWALGLAALAFMLGRVLHAIGMDSGEFHKARMIGMILTMPVLLGLAIAAILTAFRVM